MNRNALALFVVLIVVILDGCQQAAPDTNRNLTATASATPAKEAFDPVAIQTELIKLERDWADAAKTHNAEPVKRLLAEDAIIVYPDGTSATKADEVHTIESGAITAEGWDLMDPKVTVISADSAFITGRTIFKKATYKDPSQKKAMDISGEYRFLDVYARRNGTWQAVASQATKVANPSPAASPAASVPSPSPKTSPSPTPSPKTSPTP